MSGDTLVFAGGGVAGIAWETGVLLGLQDMQPDAVERMLDPEVTFIGTSAGSAVAAQLAGGTALVELFDAQTAETTTELAAEIDLVAFGAQLAESVAAATSPEDARRRIGAIALAADTVPGPARLAVIDARLPVKTWSERTVLITAIDAETGALRVFDRFAGVSIVDAVAASCAVPGIWPTVEIEGHRYMDGGMRSVANLDLAAGADRVLVLVPMPEEAEFGGIPPADLDALGHARVHVVYADDASIAAFGPNPLDPTVRAASALAGRRQGRRIAAEVAEFWD